MNKVLFAIGCGALLGACGSTPERPYQDSAAADSAVVSFRNATTGRAAITLYDDATRCTGPRPLPDLLIGEETAARASPGKPLAFTFRYTVPNTTPTRYCEVTASFLPRAGARYQATLEPEGEGSCVVEIAEVSLAGNGQVQSRKGVQATRREPNRLFFREGACTPLE